MWAQNLGILIAGAKYLYELKQSGDLNVDFIQVAEMCGGSTRKAVIDNQIEAYRHMQKWKDLDMSGRLEYAPKEFQKFFQYQMRKPRLEDVGIDEDEFLDHVSKNRIYRAADVRKLHKIWQDPTVDPNQTSRKNFS